MTHMSEFPLWGAPGHQVAVLHPSMGDLFVMTTVNGMQVSMDPVTKFDAAVRRANKMADRLVHPERVVIKVLCLSFLEACKVQGLNPATLFEHQTPDDAAAMRQQAITNCNDALRNSNDPRVRAEALELLKVIT